MIPALCEGEFAVPKKQNVKGGKVMRARPIKPVDLEMLPYKYRNKKR